MRKRNQRKRLGTSKKVVNPKSGGNDESDDESIE